MCRLGVVTLLHWNYCNRCVHHWQMLPRTKGRPENWPDIDHVDVVSVVFAARHHGLNRMRMNPHHHFHANHNCEWRQRCCRRYLGADISPPWGRILLLHACVSVHCDPTTEALIRWNPFVVVASHDGVPMRCVCPCLVGDCNRRLELPRQFLSPLLPMNQSWILFSDFVSLKLTPGVLRNVGVWIDLFFIDSLLCVYGDLLFVDIRAAACCIKKKSYSVYFKLWLL